MQKNLTVSSLYFVKGVNYTGPPFSLHNNELQKLTVFSELELSEIYPHSIVEKLWLGTSAYWNNLPNVKLSDVDIEQRLLKQYNQNSKAGFFVQISSHVKINIELRSLEDEVKKLTPDNLYPVPVDTKQDKNHLVYYKNSDLAVADLQDELNCEFVEIEKGEANIMSTYLIKNGNTSSVSKLASAAFIESDEMQIWLKPFNFSITENYSVALSDSNSMVDNFYSESKLSSFVDGLLLMQSFGYNTITPYAQFMSLWGVLEKLINKSFKKISKKRIVEIAQNHKDLLNARTVDYLEALQDLAVERNKFNIVDKFIVTASEAGIEPNNDMLKLFKDIKKIRDALHSSICERGHFPTKSIYKILRMLCVNLGDVEYFGSGEPPTPANPVKSPKAVPKG
ncbi:hypothetical protein D0S45_03480 [Marinifilum sp. JC120]|nr:hypothetical protein D0S45_03480 [Marinifilum sp. JC120]